MSNRKQPPARGAHGPRKHQGGGLGSYLIPILAGVIVLAIIVGAVIAAEGRQKAVAAVPGTISVPVVTTQPRPTTVIPYPDVPRISLKDTQKKLETGEAVLIDVRSKAAYDQSHAAGALSIPEEEIEARLGELPQGKLLVLY